MKKLILLLLCGVFVPLLGACGKNEPNESNALIGQSNSVENSEILDSEDASSSTVSSSECVEGGGTHAAVAATYQFETSDEYAQFYNEFIKLNEERYHAPIVSIGEEFDTVKYVFDVAPVPCYIARNQLYVGVEFSSAQTMSFNFKKDQSELWNNRYVLVSGEMFNVANTTFENGDIMLTKTDEYIGRDASSRQYDVCIGDMVICSFEVYSRGYDDNVEKLDGYSTLIQNSFMVS